MNQKFMATTLQSLLIILLTASFGCQAQNIPKSNLDKRAQITTMYQKYAQEFPQVKGITVEELKDLQQHKQNLVLIDVRSPDERAVSIIPGAITPEEFESNLAQYSQDDVTVVAYCTIGYRSGKYADQLRKQGINILNLEGSLLAWSHVRGTLTNANGITDKIHVFGRQWQLTANDYQAVW